MDDKSYIGHSFFNNYDSLIGLLRIPRPLDTSAQLRSWPVAVYNISQTRLTKVAQNLCCPHPSPSLSPIAFLFLTSLFVCNNMNARVLKEYRDKGAKAFASPDDPYLSARSQFSSDKHTKYIQADNARLDQALLSGKLEDCSCLEGEAPSICCRNNSRLG